MVARNKYRAVKTTIDGIIFDSKAEAKRYSFLKLRERAGEIANVELQKPFILTAGKANQVVATYKADFAYDDLTSGEYVVEDVKGVDTPVSRLKRKFVKALYGIDVKVIK